MCNRWSAIKYLNTSYKATKHTECTFLISDYQFSNIERPYLGPFGKSVIYLNNLDICTLHQAVEDADIF